MTGERKHIDNLFRDGLNGYRHRPPVHAWNRLDGSLDAARTRKRVLVYRLAAASVVILMAFGAGYFYATYVKQPDNVAKREVLIDTPKDTPGLKGTESGQSDVVPIQQLDPEETTTEQTASTGGESPTGNGTAIPVQSELAQHEDSHESKNGEPLKDEAIEFPGREKEIPVTTMAFLNPTSVEPAQTLSAEPTLVSSAREPVNFEDFYYYPQDYESGTKQRLTSWNVGAQFAPIYSYREISANYGTNVSGNQQDVIELNDAEEGLMSYAGGVDVAYNFSSRWSVQSGVYFSRIGQVNADALEFKQSNSEFQLFGIATSTGRINVAFERVPQNVRKFNAPKDSIGPGSIVDVKVIQNFDLFEVPLLIRYKFLDRKFSMNLTGGLSPAYLLGNNTYLEMQDSRYDIGDAGNLNSMIVNTSLGMGFSYSVTRALSVNFEPMFKYSLNPINNSSNINYHPYSFSWFTGIRLKID